MSRDFDGSSGYLSLGDASALNPVLPMTVAAWVWPDSVAAGSASIISRATTLSGTQGWSFGRSGDELQFIRRGIGPVPTTTFNLVTGGWVFVGVRVTSGTNNCNYIKIGTDGAITTEVRNGNFTGFATAYNAAYVARIQGSGSADFWSGKIAHIGVWMGDNIGDNQMRAYAFYGPNAIPYAPDFYMPLWGIASPEAELSGNKVNGTANGTCPAFTPEPPMSFYAPMPTHLAGHL